MSPASFDATPMSNRIHIAVLGRMNSGKSSLINAICGQDVSVVSPVAGTTTDIVYKAMEIHGLGPVVFIDTPGIDDESVLADARVARTRRAINKADMALVVIDATQGAGGPESTLFSQLDQRHVPYAIVVNKTDMVQVSSDGREFHADAHDLPGAPRVPVSAMTREGLGQLIEAIRAVASRTQGTQELDGPPIVGDLLTPGDTVVLVIPEDVQAPRGRLILPQVQTIRDILDHNAVAMATRVAQLEKVFAAPAFRPRLVITDSQAFREVDALVPGSVDLTSFSILFARHKGDLGLLARGAHAIESLEPGDNVLIVEACTHHPVDDDIGAVKIPRLLKRKAGGELSFEWRRGVDFPADLARFKLAVHCGGCMLNRREMVSRLDGLEDAGVPVTNYGMTIAACLGILPRALAPLGLSAESADW
ncbi:MAG: [FeFe] hydrogenase H-cluster maturation GTPase HydF [Clostridia bacterium]|nr:[FeFe] hydrogenase H-cluster maturation GTPase HydF [Clostridia bacterium]